MSNKRPTPRPRDELKRQGFQPGVCPNKKGRPPVIQEVRELAKQQTEAAIRTIVAIMEDPKANASARVAAAEAILDRGWGKPKQHVDLDATGGFVELLKVMNGLRAGSTGQADSGVDSVGNDEQPATVRH